MPSPERPAPGPLAVAIDIGGTFTDVMLHDSRTGQAWRA